MLELRDRRQLVLAGTVAALAAAAAFVLLAPNSDSRAGSSLPTSAASRGNVIVTVGGVGRIVEARAAGSLVVPVSTPASTATAAATTPTPAVVSPDSVFPSASGRVDRILVSTGQRVRPGQPIVVLGDGQIAASAIEQARNDAATARLELRQKQTNDIAKGLPPTPAELQAAHAALRSAQERARLVGHPPSVDVTAAQADVRKAEADLATLTRRSGTQALAAARLAVAVATQRLAQTSGPPTPVDVPAAQTEIAKAQADLDALRATPAAPSETALQAAELAVTLAQQRLSELPPGSPASDRTAAELELKKAQADLETLRRPPAAPSPSAIAAAQAALDLANQRLALLTSGTSPLAVATAQLDVVKARADLEALRRPAARPVLTSARFAVVLAHRRLAQLLHPGPAARDTARSDVARVRADLAVLLQRGAPAGAVEIAIARLKVAAADDRIAAAERQAARLVVRAPLAGTVTAVFTALGAPADPTTPVATVSDLHHLAVGVDLSEFDVARVRSGQPAVVRVDALGGRSLPGHVTFVAFSGVDNGGVVTFPVRVSFTPSAGVKPGMNVSVRIIVARRTGVVRVPLEAVHGRTVSVVGTGPDPILRRVVLGLSDNKLVEIRRGLHAGERVVVSTTGG